VVNPHKDRVLKSTSALES